MGSSRQISWKMRRPCWVATVSALAKRRKISFAPLVGFVLLLHYCFAAPLAAQQLRGSHAQEVYDWIKAQQADAKKGLDSYQLKIEYDRVVPPPAPQIIEAARKRVEESPTAEHRRWFEWYRSQAAAGSIASPTVLFLGGKEGWRFNTEPVPWSFHDFVHTPSNSWAASHQKIILHGPGGEDPSSATGPNAKDAANDFALQIPAIFFGALAFCASHNVTSVQADATSFSAEMQGPAGAPLQSIMRVSGGRKNPQESWQCRLLAVDSADAALSLRGVRISFGDLVRFPDVSIPIYQSYRYTVDDGVLVMGITVKRVASLDSQDFARAVVRPTRELQVPLRGKLTGEIFFTEFGKQVSETFRDGKKVDEVATGSVATGSSWSRLRTYGWIVIIFCIGLGVLLRLRSRGV